jgi:hypothetical protein
MRETYKTRGRDAGQDAGMTDETPVRFDTRIAVILRDGLLPWQELNVTAFLISGIAADPALLGEIYEDADGIRYLPMLAQPVMVFASDGAGLALTREKAVDRDLRVAVYTRDMFSTGHDAANRAAVRAVGSADLDLVGIGLHGPRNAVDRLTKAARKHD